LVAPTPTSPIFSAMCIACFIVFVSCGSHACGSSALPSMNSHEFEVETMCFGTVQAYTYYNCWHYYGLVCYFLSDENIGSNHVLCNASCNTRKRCCMADILICCTISVGKVLGLMLLCECILVNKP
jgi:hypothetical protein